MKKRADNTGKSVIIYSELSHESCQFSEREWFVSAILQRDCHFVEEFFNFKPAINKNSPWLIRGTEKQTEFIVTRRQITETNQQQGSYTTRNQK